MYQPFNRLIQLSLIAILVAIATGCTKQAKRERYLARAERDFKAEKYDEAEIGYLKVLKIPPSNPTAVSRLGLIYYAEGRLPQAAGYLKRAVDLNPDDVEARLKLGLTWMAFQKLPEARQEALSVLTNQPGNEEALVLLAISAANTNEVNQVWQQLEALPPNLKGGAYHLARGTLFIRQRDLDRAEVELKQAVALQPRSSNAQATLGDLYLMRNDLKQAEPALKAAAELAPLRSNARLGYAEFKKRTGAAVEARKAVEEITKKAPDFLPAWMFLANTAFSEGRNDDCATCLNQILTREPSNFEGLMLSGKLMLARGESTNAIAKFERVATLYGRSPQVEYRLAIAQLANNEVAKAIANLSHATTTDPNFTEAGLLLAEVNIRKGSTAQAITSLNQITAQRPQIPQAHFLLASAYLAQKDVNAALGVYGRMLQLFPKSAEVPYLMGLVLEQQNREAEARQSFEKALELSPDYLPAFEKLIGLKLRDHQFDPALQSVKAEIQKAPRAADLWILLARIYEARADFQLKAANSGTNGAPARTLEFSDVPACQTDLNEAETALRKALELNPDARAPYLLLTQLYVATKRHQQALDTLNGVIARTNDVPAMMQIALIQDRLKNYPAAAEAYEKVLKVSPSFGPALNNLAYLYAEQMGKVSQAYTLAEKARQIQPNDPGTADTLGWILYRRGDYSRALVLLQESAAKLGWQAEVQFHLGMTHYMLGDEQQARLALERTLQAAEPDFSGKEEAGQRLTLLNLDPKKADASAIALLEKQLQRTPGDAIALLKLGEIQERNGSVEKAIASYEAARKNGSENSELELKLAELYARQPSGQSQAIELAKQAHNRAPEDPKASHLLARLAFASGDYKWASSLLQDCLRANPDDPQVLYDLAWAYYSLGRTNEATDSMRKALDVGKTFSGQEDARRFVSMSNALAEPGEAAGREAGSILSQDPLYVPALMVYGAICERGGKYRDAAQLYDKALSRFPLFMPATRNLALLCFEHLGEDDKAFELASKARESYLEDPALAKALGILSYRRGDYSRAVQLLEESDRKRTQDGELIYYLGMAQCQSKQAASGKENLQRALALNLPSSLADEARRAIRDLK